MVEAQSRPVAGRMTLVVGLVYLGLLVTNLFIAPRNDAILGTYEQFDITGRVFVVLGALVFVLGSVGIVLIFARGARRRRESSSRTKDVRDIAWMISSLTVGSLLPMGVIALMRDDSAGSGPFVNGASIGTIALVAFVVAIVLSIFDWTRGRQLA